MDNLHCCDEMTEIYCNASDKYIRSPIADQDINYGSVMGQLARPT